jgi:general secretion pathway protein G
MNDAIEETEQPSSQHPAPSPESPEPTNRVGAAEAERIVAESERGMTLVEIMIVITIMASIMGVVGYYVFGTLNQANAKTARLGINQLEGMVSNYYMLQSPSQLPENLNELTEGSNPMVKDKSTLQDPWGNQYIYEKKGGQDYEIYSAGPDGQPGTEDDVKLDDN